MRRWKVVSVSFPPERFMVPKLVGSVSRARLAKDLKRRCGLSDELLKGVSSRVFERRPIKIGPYTSPLRETSDGRCDAVRKRDSTGVKAGPGNKGKGYSEGTDGVAYIGGSGGTVRGSWCAEMRVFECSEGSPEGMPLTGVCDRDGER